MIIRYLEGDLFFGQTCDILIVCSLLALEFEIICSFYSGLSHLPFSYFSESKD